MRCFIWDVHIHIRQSDPNKTYVYQKRCGNTSKELGTIMCPSSGLWGSPWLWFLVYHPEFTIVRWATALTLYERGFLSLSPHTRRVTLCPIFSLSPSLVGRSRLLAPTGGRTQSANCVLRIPVSHNQQRVCQYLSFLLVHYAFWFWDLNSLTHQLLLVNY